MDSIRLRSTPRVKTSRVAAGFAVTAVATAARSGARPPPAQLRAELHDDVPEPVHLAASLGGMTMVVSICSTIAGPAMTLPALSRERS